MEERIWLLMGRVMSKEATAAEQAELQELIKDNIQLQYLQEVLVSVEMKREFLVDIPKAEELILKGQQQLNERIMPEDDVMEDKEPRRGNVKKILSWVAVAAGIALLLYIGNRVPAPVQERQKLATAHGQKQRVLLPDSSIIWLNAGSTLDYEPGFGVKHRELRFKGEAYFDVKQNAGLPMIVHTSKMTVKVLGTTFNLKAYEEDDYTEAILLQGKIAVQVSEENIVLLPQQKLHLRHQGEKPGKKPGPPSVELSTIHAGAEDHVAEELSWMKNKMVFRKTSFANVARDMERWFNVSITFGDPALEDELLSGAFSGDDVQLAMKALQLTTDFKYSIEGRSITIYR